MLGICLIGALASPARAAQPAPDPCQQPEPREGDAAAPPAVSPGRESSRLAVQKWDAVYTRCPTPDNLWHLADAYDVMGQRERSIFQMERAIALYERYLKLGAPDRPREEVEKRVAALRGLVAARRGGPVLDRAREQASLGRWQAAVGFYDRYLKEEPDAADRTAVAGERARALDQWQRETKHYERGRQGLGWTALLAGAGCVGVGAILFTQGRSAGAHLTESANVGVFDDQRQMAVNRTGAGVALMTVGAVGVVFGMVRLIAGKREAPPRQALWVAPSINGNGPGMVVGGVF